MDRTCRQCQQAFEVTEEDLAFYDKVSPIFNEKKESVSPPTFCPECRLRRRMTFRNQIYVYLRPAHPDGAQIFSMHTDRVPFPVLRNEEWVGDSWSPLDYGQEPAWDQPLFAQFQQLSQRVPQPALASTRNENCEYCNNLSDNKNCYMVFNTSGAQDCMYCENAWGSRDCIECTWTLQSELCYACTSCARCYGVQNAEFCEDCSDCFFLSYCRSCKNCFGCVNLRHKEYCIFNEQKTKEEYDAFLRSFPRTSFQAREQALSMFRELSLRHPRPHALLRQVEGGSGNFIQEAKDVENCYFIQHAENLRHCFNLHEGVKDSMDYTFFGRRAELMYDCVSCGIDVQRLLFCYQCREGSSNLAYCWFCDSCQDCFGCISLRRKRYCVLNRQYTKEEYDTLVPKLIEQMRQAGEWGEFFPVSISPHPYNRSCAMRYFPLSPEQVQQQGGFWYEDHFPEAQSAIEASALPDDLPPTDEPLVVRSAFSGKPFKITAQELKRYRQFAVPLPRLTYDERMEQRMQMMGGVRLYDRTCAKTGKPILTTYPPDSPYIIWDKEEYEREFGS